MIVNVGHAGGRERDVLPPGVRAAPLGPDDAGEITAVWRACERHDDGRAEIVPADVVAFLRGPRLDFERDTVGIRAGADLVALCVQLGERLTFVRVLPAWRGRGIGTWLARWSQDAARALGATSTAQSVSEHERAAMALLEAEGYERRWRSGCSRSRWTPRRRRRCSMPATRSGPCSPGGTSAPPST